MDSQSEMAIVVMCNMIIFISGIIMLLSSLFIKETIQVNIAAKYFKHIVILTGILCIISSIYTEPLNLLILCCSGAICLCFCIININYFDNYMDTKKTN